MSLGLTCGRVHKCMSDIVPRLLVPAMNKLLDTRKLRLSDTGERLGRLSVIESSVALQHLRFEKERQCTLLRVVLHQRLAKVKLLPM